MLTPKTRFCRLKEYFISEIVFYGGNLSFCREKLVEIPVLIQVWKRVLYSFVIREIVEIQVSLTPKTRFCRLKEYFIAEKLFYENEVETSIFLEKNLYKFRFLFRV